MREGCCFIFRNSPRLLVFPLKTIVGQTEVQSITSSRARANAGQTHCCRRAAWRHEDSRSMPA